MPTGDVLPLLLTLFGLVAVGQLLRLAGAVPDNAADVLGKIIVRVTMPALIVVILADARYDPALLPMLVANTAALLAALALAVLLLRALGGARPAQGAAGLVAAFSNTAFLGLPFVLALFPGRPGPATAAVIVDTVDTTLLLLTFGTAFAGAMARGRPPGAPASRLRSSARALATQPMLIAVALALALAAADVPLPAALARPLAQIGHATPTLAFLTIGLGLDLRSLRGQVPALAGIAVIKLIVAPAIAGLVLLALGVRGEIAHVSVLQAGMPTAVVSAIIAAGGGCDARLAAAAVVITTLLALVTLPLLVVVLQALGV